MKLQLLAYYFNGIAAAGSFISEYIGEVIDNQESDIREAKYKAANKRVAQQAHHRATSTASTHDDPDASVATAATVHSPPGDCYMFRIDLHWVIDATVAGSLARFINHSCNPNCEARTVRDSRDRPHICIYAKQDIVCGDELTYDYCFLEEEGQPPLVCKCGVEGCCGRMDRPVPMICPPPAAEKVGGGVGEEM